MIGGLSLCKTVKVTPSNITLLTITNPTSIVPKLVHIKCDHTSEPYSVTGFNRELWCNPRIGWLYCTNGSSGIDVINALQQVAQTPTSVNTYHLDASTLSFYKGSGQVTGKWNTNTEYEVEIYT